MTDADDITIFEKFMAGGLGGSIGILFGNPFDVYKIRMINDVDIKNPQYSGLRDVMRKSWAKEGIKGLWKGINANVLRSFLVNAAELSAYDVLKKNLVNKLGMDPDSSLTHFFSSAVAGFCGAVCSSPADVIKTRYMNQLK